MLFKYTTFYDQMKGKLITGAAILVVLWTIDKENISVIDYVFYAVAIVWSVISIKDWRDRHAKR